MIFFPSYLRSGNFERNVNPEKLECCFHLRISLFLRPILGRLKGLTCFYLSMAKSKLRINWIKSLRFYLGTETVYCCLLQRIATDRHELKLEKRCMSQLFQGWMLSGMFRLRWALFRIWRTILHFHAPLLSSFLTFELNLSIISLFGQHLSTFFTIFYILNVIFCLRNVFSKPRWVILLSWIWIIPPSRLTVVMKMQHYPFNRGKSRFWKKKKKKNRCFTCSLVAY